MDDLDAIFRRLSQSHRAALQWFAQRRGQEIPWPQPMPDGTYLVNRPKGIQKPKGWEYALSVRVALDSKYDDAEVAAIRADGTFGMRYAEEVGSRSDRESEYTNRGMAACMRAHIPVGVLRQVKSKPAPRYKVLGLAEVTEWKNGYFSLVGLAPEGMTASNGVPPDVSPLRDNFDPSNVEDVRRRELALIVCRQGQGRFRAELLDAYEGRCAITGYDVAATLEAAHITPYLGDLTNFVANGLLLRADLHTLFDLGLIAVDPSNMTLLVSSSLVGSRYYSLVGTTLRLPAEAAKRPSEVALADHRSRAQL